MKPIDRIGDNAYRGIKAKRKVGSRDVIVDGLGHRHELVVKVAPQIVGCRKSTFTADHNRRREIVLFPVVTQSTQRLWMLEGIETGSAQNSAASWQDSGHCFPSERNKISFDQALPPVLDSHYA